VAHRLCTNINRHGCPILKFVIHLPCPFRQAPSCGSQCCQCQLTSVAPELVLCDLQGYDALTTQPTSPTAGAAFNTDYQLWESYVNQPWNDKFSYSHMWWDREACARQLPYHRILVADAIGRGYNPYDVVYNWCDTPTQQHHVLPAIHGP
jgi:hypothetical protein